MSFATSDVSVMVTRMAATTVLEEMCAKVDSAQSDVRFLNSRWDGIATEAYSHLHSKYGDLETMQGTLHKLSDARLDEWLKAQPSWFTDAVRRAVAVWAQKQFAQEV